MSFDLEKNVPMAGTRQSWPFAAMKLGDSFAIPADEALIQRARKAATLYAKRGAKFTVRKQEDGTARCWRTA